MHNSLTAEEDKQDETTVPADSYKGTMDIRDKEYARAFMKVIEKGAVLTAVFDSCHSGSIARGLPMARRMRKLPPVDVDVAEPPDPGPRPEDRGALILSAAQDFQLAVETHDEDGAVHGLFTWAFAKVLRSVAVNESADRVFLRIRAMMQAGDTPQEPSIAGTVERRARGRREDPA